MAKKDSVKKTTAKKAGLGLGAAEAAPPAAGGMAPAPADAPTGEVLDRLWRVVSSRRAADPSTSHSARLMSRGTAKVAQKLGEEAVECVIEAVAGNRDALIAESADVLYHLIVVWVNAGLRADEIWTELERREGISGIAEKAGRAQKLAIPRETRKLP